MREEKILINGLGVNFKIIGEGKPLLILHGWSSNSEKWQEVGEWLAKNGLRAIIPDLPGFGKSDKPPRPWDLDDYRFFIEKFIEHLNLEKFYLLGHSFGGAVAVKCSLKFPEKIKKLFLVEAACFRERAFRKRLFYIISKILKIFSFLPFYGQARKGFYRFIIRKSDYPYTEGVMKSTYLRIIKQDLSKVLTQIQIPTVIIWGQKDKIKKIKEAYLIKEKIKNSELKILLNVGHTPHLKLPFKLAETITFFSRS